MVGFIIAGIMLFLQSEKLRKSASWKMRVLAVLSAVCLFGSGHMCNSLWREVDTYSVKKEFEASDDFRDYMKTTLDGRVAAIMAFRAESRRRYKGAEQSFSDAYSAFFTLSVMSYYKKYCSVWARGEYARTLSGFEMMFDAYPELASKLLYNDGKYVSMKYVCIYAIKGPLKANVWLDKIQEKLDEHGKQFISYLKRTSVCEEKWMAMDNGLQRWEKRHMLLCWAHLAEISAEKSKNDIMSPSMGDTNSAIAK